MKITVGIDSGKNGNLTPAFVVTKGGFPAKEALKAFGFRWDAAAKVWFIATGLAPEVMVERLARVGFVVEGGKIEPVAIRESGAPAAKPARNWMPRAEWIAMKRREEAARRERREAREFEARWGVSAEDIEDDLHIDTSNDDEMRAHGFVPRW